MPRRVLVFQKQSDSTQLWKGLTEEFEQEYRLVFINRQGIDCPPQEDAETVVQIMAEMQWSDAILVAHGDDCRLLRDLAALAPKRISALFLVDAPDDVHLSGHHSPFLHVTTANSDRQDPFVLEKTELLPEVFHAFCTLRLR
ncbi:hypothetical protein JJB07_16240 [Tumebacillus sp. ITR2]|uniref:Uncharacterized protein n=1 Tax=Tumebacillus amylolyticus TaxID=2801339 RepID=A0ABS1JF28_9BACL|nr:hypothetical protein [Tumebacillus amylolyticus]MBL0388168.1 hypothetical protein [Tumebacillus amylolyticus]